MARMVGRGRGSRCLGASYFLRRSAKIEFSQPRGALTANYLNTLNGNLSPAKCRFAIQTDKGLLSDGYDWALAHNFGGGTAG